METSVCYLFDGSVLLLQPCDVIWKEVRGNPEDFANGKKTAGFKKQKSE